MPSVIITPNEAHKFEGHQVEQLGNASGTHEGNICPVRAIATGDEILIPLRYIFNEDQILQIGTTVFIDSFEHDRTKGVIKTLPYKDRYGMVFYGVEHAGRTDVFEDSKLSK